MFQLSFSSLNILGRACILLVSFKMHCIVQYLFIQLFARFLRTVTYFLDFYEAIMIQLRRRAATILNAYFN